MKEVEGGFVSAHYTKYNKRITNENAKVALNLVLLWARFGSEYKVEVEHNDEGTFVIASDAEEVLVDFDASDFDIDTVFAEALDMALELDIDIEYLNDRVVVPHAYRERYRAAGDPDSNGDPIAVWAKGLFTEEVEGKPTFNVHAFDMMLQENGVELTGPWQDMKDTKQRGWQGRYRMNGGQKLRVAIGRNGKLVHLGETVKLPKAYLADLVAKHAKKEKKDK